MHSTLPVELTVDEVAFEPFAGVEVIFAFTIGIIAGPTAYKPIPIDISDGTTIAMFFADVKRPFIHATVRVGHLALSMA